VGLTLSVTLGDFGFILRALRENLLRIGAALVFADGVGSLFSDPASASEIASGTVISQTGIVVALAAGAIALSTGVPSTLIGVMVATALMPPLVVTGMLYALGEMQGAIGSLQLLAENLISVNLAGILTFLVMGFRPGYREGVPRARTLVTLALLVWLALLVVLILLIV